MRSALKYAATAAVEEIKVFGLLKMYLEKSQTCDKKSITFEDIFIEFTPRGF
jgi:hypothetical protein